MENKGVNSGYWITGGAGRAKVAFLIKGYRLLADTLWDGHQRLPVLMAELF
ncbi:hypothetical protein [Acerihabitans sp.]|uniref:hypothetical protein n=1 Tax=Acerihabitans sp. TaxID=2811394 RepID=UPI002ED88B57